MTFKIGDKIKRIGKSNFEVIKGKNYTVKEEQKRPLNPFLLSYESLLRSALNNWYCKQCKFPKDEAKIYTEKFILKNLSLIYLKNLRNIV